MKSLLTKILAVQKAIEPIRKDSVNPHFQSRYFDINSVVGALRPILNESGLVVIQGISGAQLVTTVGDPETGEEKSFPMDLPAISDPQKLGAAISYYRRYSLVSLFLLEAEDDDGNSASALSAGVQAKAKVIPVRAPAPAAEPARDAFDDLPPFPDGPISHEPVAPAADLGTCADCGAKKVHNPKTGKNFCEKKCWLQK